MNNGIENEFKKEIEVMSESSGYNPTEFSKGNKIFNKQQYQMKVIIKYLSTEFINSNDEFDSIISKIDDYIDDHSRFLYSVIYSFVVDLDPDSNLSLNSNIEKIYEYCLDKSHPVNKNVIKLYDYITLAILQKDRLNDTKEEVFKIQLESEKAKNSIVQLNEASIKQSEEFQNSKSKFYDQLIAAMAIFISVAFIIFGGISSLSGLSVPLSKVIDTGENSIILYKAVIIWALGMINLLSLFMIFISKILDKSLVIKKIYYQANIVFIALFLILIAYQAILKITS